MQRIFLMGIIFLSIPLLTFAQNDSLYKKSETFDGTIISVEQDNQDFPRTYTLRIERNNSLISKKDTLYDGQIERSWISDMDNDKNPEINILIQTVGADRLDLYEFSNYSLKSYSFPDLPVNLTNKQWKVGQAQIKWRNGKLVKTSGLYNQNDAMCCPSAGTATITYTFNGNAIAEIGYQISQENTSSNSKSILVHVITIKGLPKMDAFSQTDAWVEISINNQEVGRTKKIQDSENPYFNEEITIGSYEGGEVIFTVYDRDATGNDIVGKASLIELKSGNYPILHTAPNGDISKKGMIEIEVK